MADSPVPPFAYGYAIITGSGEVVHESGQIAKQFPLASVTKLITALGVHAAVEDGLFNLDDAAGPQGSTVRHLLAHASGLAPEGDGTVTASRVGTRRIYSNQGYEVLGSFLEKKSGVPVSQWMHERILEPLGAVDTTFEGSPAHGARSSVADLALLAQEFVSPQVLRPEAIKEMTAPAFPDLIGVLPGYGRQDPNPWGLGPELKGNKHPHWTPSQAGPQTFGHFGQSGSFLWVDPVVNRAGIFLGSEPFGQWHKENWPLFSL